MLLSVFMKKKRETFFTCQYLSNLSAHIDKHAPSNRKHVKARYIPGQVKCYKGKRYPALCLSAPGTNGYPSCRLTNSRSCGVKYQMNILYPINNKGIT